MKTKRLDAKNLAKNEDWEGNNVAFECPVCGKLYLVSGHIHNGERKCPNCMLSRGVVRGGKESGGTAAILWDEAPDFELDKFYSREQIARILGGGTEPYLPTSKGRIVCGCFNREYNPEAPGIILPGTGIIVEKTAVMFSKQKDPVPVFVKQSSKNWKYVGTYKVERFSTDRKEIAQHHQGSRTPLERITSLMVLKRVNPPGVSQVDTTTPVRFLNTMV